MILTYGDSEKGLVRRANEDAISMKVDGLYLLADGMGGYDGGQIASSLAVESGARYFSSLPSEKAFSEEGLKEAFCAANRAILAEKRDSPALQSMGTTMVGAAVKGNHLFWAHVGDSRLYRYEAGELTQVTTDHSFVMELVTEGKLTKEEMRRHPRKNEITRAVGIDENMKVDTGSFSLSDGTLILICSDGVSGMVEDEDLARLISGNPRKTKDDLKALASSIMEKVYDAGARDNASLILIQFWN
ncbi:Stp1/IreP family PP2C-type Ser/Thr phosphatase [Dialister sp.]|jgi:protein phosphatase|uniref:Stp1/IreP family PP2C-type Ser/Thr phosphatase n=1 Tax=Dialister sp. TaxID=1955814 RepID=UPI003A5BA59E